MKKLGLWALGAFVVFYLLKAPGKAAHTTTEALGLLAWAAGQGIKFISSL